MASQGDTPRAGMLQGGRWWVLPVGLPRQVCGQLGHGDTAEAETPPKPARGPPTAFCVVRKPPGRRRDLQGPGSFGSGSLKLGAGCARRGSAPGQLLSEPMPALAWLAGKM